MSGYYMLYLEYGSRKEMFNCFVYNVCVCIAVNGLTLLSHITLCFMCADKIRESVNYAEK